MPARSQVTNRRAYIEELHLARSDETFRELVNDLRHATCLADTDPSAPHRPGLSISRYVPSIEECGRRIDERLAELRIIWRKDAIAEELTAFREIRHEQETRDYDRPAPGRRPG